jgi:acyl-CoA reductase-like NAD-dependent aldehyde dehydrogenase
MNSPAAGLGGKSPNIVLSEKQCGNGREHAVEGREKYMEVKSILGFHVNTSPIQPR